MSEPPEQLSIDIAALPSEPTRGGAPCSREQFEQAKQAFYDGLIERIGSEPNCLPDHGVHVYPSHRGVGPCICTTKRTAKGSQ